MADNKKNSLVNNINRRKKAGKSRSKKSSTVSKKAYGDMKSGWEGKKKKSSNKKKTTAKKSTNKKSASRKTAGKSGSKAKRSKKKSS